MRTISTKPDLTAQVQLAIIDAIASGEFIAGERLTQEELADRLGVSRQPVLQALVLLRDQGLIVDAPNRRGLLIAPLDRKFILDLYELRSALDGAAGAAAARRSKTIDQNKGHRLLRQGRDAVNQQSIKLLVQADHAFHQFIYDAADNQLLIDSAERHWHHTRRTMASHLKHAPDLSGVWDEHEAMLQAILDGSVRQAERLSRLHADRSLKLILQHFPKASDASNEVAA